MRISGEYLAQIRRNRSSNVTVRIKTATFGVQSKLIWFLELYISESANPRKASFLQAGIPLGMILEKNKI